VSAMWSLKLSRSGFILLNVAAYLTLLTMAIPTLIRVPGGDRLWVGGLLALFGGFITLFPRVKRSGAQPHLYLAAQALIVATIFLRFPGVGLSHVHLLFFVLSAYAMLLLPLLPAVAWIVGFFVFTMGVAAGTEGWMHALGLSAVAGGHALFGSFGALLRQSEHDRQQTETLLQELRSTHRQLQEYAAQAEQLAVAEERNRLAREMHDALGHRLTVAVVQLEGAQRLIPSDPQRAANMVGAMREEVKTALGELRQTVAALRSEPQEELPLAEALRQLTRSFGEATGLQVTVDAPPELPALPAAHRLALFRAAQEGLTNVQRHAGAARARVSLQVDGGRVALCVADDGRGFPETLIENGLGLRGLRERAAELQGEVCLANGPQGGAQLSVHLPWPAEA